MPSTIAGTTITRIVDGDEALKTANGGHLSSLLGTGTLPMVDTGAVTAGGTDNAMEVTGGIVGHGNVQYWVSREADCTG